MEEFHLPQSQVSLRESKTFHYKVLSKLYCNSELTFLVNFNYILSALKRYKVYQGLLKDVQGFLDLVVTILDFEKEINCLLF